MTDQRMHDYKVRKLTRDLDRIKSEYGILTDEAIQELFEAIDRCKGKLLAAL